MEPEPTNLSQSYLDDEIDLKELFGVLWASKKLIILITSFFFIGVLIYSFLLPNYYRSESVLVARDASANQSLLSQYSGVASLVGVSLPGSGDTKVSEIIEIIKSRKFVKHLITFENILPSIIAAKSYDGDSKELIFDTNIFDSKTKIWTRNPRKYKTSMPSYIEAHELYIEELLNISQDKITSFIHISIEHISPIFAKEFLELIIREANSLKRTKDIEESSEALQYLKLELSATPLVVIQEAINALIEAQLEMKMMAQINEDYSLVSIEPPFIPEGKSKPSRFILVAIGIILGFLIGSFVVLIRHYYLGDIKTIQGTKN